ncbi:MAG TPA: type II toxin-antitoxin system PemK/MazF family toxin [Candidatus Anammoximicrobium sp.]|nr:type II toxin-antitoxin system PemK/MazF family toxin [Candidatus Anammoximicrobium sp.]
MRATYQRGDVLLVTLTYSSQTGVKKRPVVVLRDVGDADMLVAPVASQTSRVAYDVRLADWPQEGLRLPSVVRTEKLATVEKSAIVRILGHLSGRDWSAVEANLAAVFREIVPF